MPEVMWVLEKICNRIPLRPAPAGGCSKSRIAGRVREIWNWKNHHLPPTLFDVLKMNFIEKNKKNKKLKLQVWKFEKFSGPLNI